jgi:hypothetical protein
MITTPSFADTAVSYRTGEGPTELKTNEKQDSENEFLEMLKQAEKKAASRHAFLSSMSEKELLVKLNENIEFLSTLLSLMETSTKNSLRSIERNTSEIKSTTYSMLMK